VITEQVTVAERLRRMGYAQGNVVRVYGEEFELVSDPINIGDQLVAVDAIEIKSGNLRRVRLPLSLLHMLRKEPRVA
jgi:hypothetical protein